MAEKKKKRFGPGLMFSDDKKMWHLSKKACRLFISTVGNKIFLPSYSGSDLISNSRPSLEFKVLVQFESFAWAVTVGFLTSLSPRLCEGSMCCRAT